MTITTTYTVRCVFPLHTPTPVLREIDAAVIPRWEKQGDTRIASWRAPTLDDARGVNRVWEAIAKRMQRMKLYHYDRWHRVPHVRDKSYRIWARSQREATALYQREVGAGKLSLALSSAASGPQKYYEAGGAMFVFIQQVDSTECVWSDHWKELS